jgi:hypothetical protein
MVAKELEMRQDAEAQEQLKRWLQDQICLGQEKGRVGHLEVVYC